MFRIIACRTALLSAVLLGLPAAALACDGADCPTPSKPLDIQKFMREQAASTRVGEPHHRATVPTRTATAPAAKPKPRHIAAKKTKPLPTETATASSEPTPAASPAAASQSAFSNVPVVTGDQPNAMDQAAAVTPPVPAPAYAPETVGGAATPDPNANVQFVVADEFNEIDRKASDTALPGNGVHTGQMPASDASKSWPRKVAGALGNVYGAFTGAMHKLTGF